ncbi:replicative DNA helicase [Holospora curviuscula]|uniref:Replicative DNA helicase n=1 Tax=Holospora curviuscula TaxID=1082868 RepID=A0A2S5R6M1_9PROT|nr:replicative DNA helicase [Holospora curviuscula]PPE02979.1 Replicative DNA helicase [Holospora curviuscula]
MSVTPTLPQTPYNLEIEQSLLSILLRNNSVFEDIGETLHPEYFYTSLHQHIFKTLSHLIRKGQIANPITLKHYVENYLQGDDVGLSDTYLAELVGLLVPTRNALYYVKVIYDLYLRRQLASLGEDISYAAGVMDVEGPDAIQQIEIAENQLFQMHKESAKSQVYSFAFALTQAIESAQLAYQRDSHVVGVSTGLLDLDKMLGGLHPSDLVILAARPAMGKTALATNIAFNAARLKMRDTENKGDGAGVGFFSLEMSALQLAMRIIAQETGVSSDRMRRGAIDKEAFPLFVDLSKELAALPLFIDDTPALSVTSLLTRARRLQRKENIKLIVVDYLQLLTTGKSNSENRVQELSEITRGLKQMAKTLNVPVLALSQLSRAVEQREDKRPMLADLRESGSIEQDADVVMFIYREEYYEARNKPQEGSEKMIHWQRHMAEIYNSAEVIIAKQRHGPTGSVFLQFDGGRTKFSNAASKTINF